eukprot:TRINITY_DN7664_c0_g2_i1.p1 TRINITY_DN7664_c0_g2~~TRINITY_DN7664_c0_g2_i1.p1  ORF type:complete len:115 (-),score=25.81 TRINITY_DN7664_c0_g2_i1:373-717(-)
MKRNRDEVEKEVGKALSALVEITFEDRIKQLISEALSTSLAPITQDIQGIKSDIQEIKDWTKNPVSITVSPNPVGTPKETSHRTSFSLEQARQRETSKILGDKQGKPKDKKKPS